MVLDIYRQAGLKPGQCRPGWATPAPADRGAATVEPRAQPVAGKENVLPPGEAPGFAAPWPSSTGGAKKALARRAPLADVTPQFEHQEVEASTCEPAAGLDSPSAGGASAAKALAPLPSSCRAEAAAAGAHGSAVAATARQRALRRMR